jgi:hypothetical protein
MILLENIKRLAEKATGLRRPDDPQSLLRGGKPHTYRFRDDGVIPNHPRWPLIIYKSAVQLPQSLDPAAVFEELFVSHGWGNSWRNGIYDFTHYHSGIHEVLGIARGRGRVRFGGANGRALTSQSSRRAQGISARRQARIFWSSAPIRPWASTTSADRPRIARRRFPQLNEWRAHARTPYTARTVL